jgi:ketosteroid isomerase-like protein
LFRRRARIAVAVAAHPGPEQDHIDALGHVEAIRSGWRAFNRRDFAGAVQYLHPDGQAFPVARPRHPREGGNAGLLRGREQVRQFLETVSNAWERVTVQLGEVIVAPDGRLLAIEGWHIHGRDGIEFETMVVTVYAFRDGLVARLDSFLDRAEALEALTQSDAAYEPHSMRMAADGTTRLDSGRLRV